MSFVKSTAVSDTDVSIERVNLALYDSYVVTGPTTGGRGLEIPGIRNPAGQQ